MDYDAPYHSDPNHPMNPPVPGVKRMIPVDLGDGIIQHMDEATLIRRTGEAENENECVAWVEYHLPADDKLVHRSVHVHLKKATVFAEAIAAALG